MEELDVRTVETRQLGVSRPPLTVEDLPEPEEVFKISRLGAVQLSASGPIVTRLVDGWLDDLAAILGGVTDAEIDPRFVEGVLVEVNRS